MKNRIVHIAFLILAGCALPAIKNENEKVFPPTNDTMLISQARYVSNTSNELVFELDLYHLAGQDFSHYVTNYYLKVNYSYLILPSAGVFQKVDDVQVQATSVASSSSVILIDESGSYDSLDHFNNRTQGIVKLCRDYINPSQYLVGGFSQNGKLGDTPTEFIEPDFSRYSDSELPALFGLAKKTGGKSNLYDAVNQALDKVAATTTPGKNVIVIAHATDEVSSVSLNGVIAKALANQVQVHILYLGSVTNANELAKLSEGTGGLFVSCPTIKELMASFEDLSLILQGSLYVQQVTIKYIPNSGTITSGQELWFTFKTHDTDYNIDNNPIVAYIKIP